MSSPILYDAVTLRHFAACQRLALCEAAHAGRPPPRWTEEVHAEVGRAANTGVRHCHAILAATWLGSPIVPTIFDQRQIFAIWIALNGGRHPPVEHAGEAQSIYFAQALGGVLATDDNAAYDFALRRLGAGRVVDSVEILRAAVGDGQITAVDAAGVAAAIRRAGRHLRRVHPARLTSADF